MKGLIYCCGSCLHECMCSCHRNPEDRVRHIMACCSPCSCGRNIYGGYIEAHIKECHKLEEPDVS